MVMKVNMELIKYAQDAIKNVGIVTNGHYPKEFGGYISSLGAAIVQSGLLPAMIFYENDDSQSNEDRTKVAKAIKLILNSEYYKMNITQRKIAEYILENDANQDDLLKNVTEAATAMKLALRLYEKSK